MLKIQSFTFNPFEENTYVFYDETGKCAIVDPGCYEKEEQEMLKNFIKEAQLEVTYLLNTHCHIDHVLGNAFVKTTYQVPFLIHKTEEQVLRAVKIYASNYGFPGYTEVLPDGYLAETDKIQIGNESLDILFVPGHAPGHIAFYHAGSKSLIAGDVLFYNSIGRTDLPGGNYNTLIESIHKKLFTLPNDVTVYPGHGPETTIGFEKKTNPFCAIL